MSQSSTLATTPRGLPPPYSPDLAPCDFWLFPKIRGCRFSFFVLVFITGSGCLAEIWWSICISKSQSRSDSGLCIYYLFIWSNFNFLHNSQWITFPTQSCLVLYSFWANLLHLLIMWLIVASISPHNLHLLFCSVLFIFAFIWLVLMA